MSFRQHYSHRQKWQGKISFVQICNHSSMRYSEKGVIPDKRIMPKYRFQFTFLPQRKNETGA